MSRGKAHLTAFQGLLERWAAAPDLSKDICIVRGNHRGDILADQMLPKKMDQPRH